jgi:hypothetical protein
LIKFLEWRAFDHILPESRGMSGPADSARSPHEHDHQPHADRRAAALDAAHHMHPFTDKAALAAKGARIITRARASG